MQCPHNQRGAGGDRNPERPVHCQEGEARNSDPNQSVSFHLSQCAGRRAPSLLDFGRMPRLSGSGAGTRLAGFNVGINLDILLHLAQGLGPDHGQ